MPSDPNIGKREREVLTAIVETFISTGEPVGSRTLSRSNREGLSAATIRNVMADLSDAGFLEQRHTSSGRVPTTDAYRYYVEQISGNAKLAPQEETMISESLAGISDVQEFMERTSRVLSLISRNVGVTVATSGAKNALEHVYFSRLGDQKVLAVLVTRSGLVRDRVLRLGPPPRQGPAPRPAPRTPESRPRSGCPLHQRKFSRLDHGIHAHRALPPHRTGTQRVRPNDAFHRTAL